MKGTDYIPARIRSTTSEHRSSTSDLALPRQPRKEVLNMKTIQKSKERIEKNFEQRSLGRQKRKSGVATRESDIIFPKYRVIVQVR